MNIVTKSVLTLSIGLALSSAVSAQSAPMPKPANEPAKVEHAKHKAPAAPQESNKPVQPLAAGKQLPAKVKDSKENKDSKESSAVQPVKAKHEKSLSSSTPAAPAAKPEPTTKPSK